MAPGIQPRGGRVSQSGPIGPGVAPPGGAGTLFHAGERAVQRRAGAERMAAQVGRNILSFVPAEFGAFLARQPFVVVASQDRPGRVWASLIAGGAGFARALDDRQILLAGAPAPGDPLEGALERPRAQIGVLAIEFGTRQRIRLNGLAQRAGDGILLTVAEAFGNCTKFIQRRLPAGQLTGPAAPAHRQSPALDARQAAIVRGADTFFIASAHPERGAARYFDVMAGSRRAAAAAWSYPKALPESARLAGYVSFDPGQLELTLDGKRLLPAAHQQVTATGTDRNLALA